MVRLIFTICLLSTASSAEWGVVISENNFFDFLYSDGRNVSVLQGSGAGVTALAYDPIYENIYFSDTSDSSVTYIKMLEVTDQAALSSPYTVVSFNSSNLYFHGLAFDPVTSSLFWTTTDFPYTTGQIWRSQIGRSPISIDLLASFKEQNPRGIVVDPCRGYIYWANHKKDSPSIDRMRLSDLKHESFISKSLGHQILVPSALAISQSEEKLYWVQEDNSSSFHFISRSNLDGSDVEEFLKFTEGHTPKSLAVTHEALYFVDTQWNSVFVVYLNDTNKVIHQLNHKMDQPQGIAVKNQLVFLTEGKHSCQPLADLREKVLPRNNISKCLFGDIMLPVKGIDCNCWSGYSGTHCEVDLCHNYCLHEGKCTLNNGEPSCNCSSNKTGQRCELESCTGTCLNGGVVVCNTSVSSQSRCSCPQGFYGPSCETPSSLCSIYCKYGERVMIPNVLDCPCNLDESLVPPRYNSYLTVGLISSLVLICLLIVGLTWQTKRLRSRPRIFKRYSVTPRPVTSPSCEIAIENCCNMNICDTPCYEPDLRTVKSDRKISKKEEKRGLLNEDELAQSSSSCRSIPDF